MMAGLPDHFQPQTLRQYITSYNEIAKAHSSAAELTVPPTTGTQGPITNPERRPAPERIEPWANVDQEQEHGIISTILREVDVLGTNDITFPARYHVDCVGEDLGRLDSESALLFFDSDTLHKPATRIIQALLASEPIRSALAKHHQQQQASRGHGSQTQLKYKPGIISFTTHLNRLDLGPGAGEKRKRDANSIITAPVLGPADVFCTFCPKEPPSDNIYVASSPLGASSKKKRSGWQLLFLEEAKSSHKLTDHIINEAVMGGKTLEPRVIMGRGVGGSESTEDCEYWFAAVCTQIYASMINKYVYYGIISTGKQYIFLSIDRDDTSVLRYSCCQHTTDIAASPLMRIVALALHAIQIEVDQQSTSLKSLRGGGGLLWSTANASFTTANSPDSTGGAETESYRAPEDRSSSMSDQLDLTTDVEPRLQDSNAMSASPAHHTNLGAGNGPSPQTSTPNPCERHASSPSAILSPPAPSQTTTVPTQELGPLYPSPPCETVLGKRHCQEDIDNDEAAQPAKRTKTADTTTLTVSPSSTSPAQAPRYIVDTQLYDFDFCTQKCLQSLVIGPDGQRPPVDPACPNAADHKNVTLSNKPFCQDLRDQLITRFDEPRRVNHIFLLGTIGETQMIMMRAHSGHIFIVKPFTDDNFRIMHNEATFYTRLRALQGRYIPVCLGTVELPPDMGMWYGDYRYTGLLLLGYAGVHANEWASYVRGLRTGGEEDQALVRALKVQVRKVLGKIHKRGILHGDVALRNVLIQELTPNRDTGSLEYQLRISIIDFELSKDKKMYKHRREKKLRRVPHTRDLDQEFSMELAKELDSCERAVNVWTHNLQMKNLN